MKMIMNIIYKRFWFVESSTNHIRVLISEEKGAKWKLIKKTLYIFEGAKTGMHSAKASYINNLVNKR